MKQVIKFFSLTFIASWVLWIGAAILMRKIALTSATSPLLSGLPFLLGTFAPALVALVLTAHADGRRGLRALLRKVVQFPSDARWYLFAVSYFVIVKVGVAALYRLITGAWPPFGHVPILLLIVAVFLSTPVQARARKIGRALFAGTQKRQAKLASEPVFPLGSQPIRSAVRSLLRLRFLLEK